MAVGTLFIYTESSTHAGTGTGLGAIDMPIQRERITDYPVIQGSGVKGALRQQFPGKHDDKNKAVVFGPDNQPDYGGAIAVGDARILAFPVRSLKGVTAWVTSRNVLARFIRDCTNLNVPLLPGASPNSTVEYTEAYASSNAIVMDQGAIILEDYPYRQESQTFTVGNLQYLVDEDPQQPRLIAEVWASWLAESALPSTDVYKNYYHSAFAQRFIILPDDDFRDFVLYSTEVNTRIKLNRDTKTVDGTALFTIEALPSDSLLYVPLTTHKPRIPSDKLADSAFNKNSSDADVLTWVKNNLPERIQIGGDETVGLGQVSLRWGGVS